MTDSELIWVNGELVPQRKFPSRPKKMGGGMSWLTLILIWVGLLVLNALALAGSVWIIVLTLRSMEVIS